MLHVVEHHSIDQLRSLMRDESNARLYRGLQIILAARQGQTAQQISTLIPLTERSIRLWITRYNQSGLDGLRDRPGRGRKPPLSPEQIEQFKARIQAGSTEADAVCTLRGEDVRRILQSEFGILRTLQSAYNLLHQLGFSVLRPRPKHPQSDPIAQAAFEKNSRKSSRKSRPNIPIKNSTFGSKMKPVSAKKAP